MYLPSVLQIIKKMAVRDSKLKYLLKNIVIIKMPNKTRFMASAIVNGIFSLKINLHKEL